MTKDIRASRLAEIDALRERIDAIDTDLVRLLSERAGCALAIGQLKRALHLAIYQPAREADVLAHVSGVNPGPLNDEAIRRLFERIIDEARRLERVAAGDEARRLEREAARDEDAAGTIESED